MIAIILTIAIVGFLVYVITLIPMPQIFKTVIYGVVAICLVIWLLQTLGVNTGFPAFHLK